MTTFADLGVRASLAAALARQGITHPFPIQELALPDALAGRDVCGKAKTGSGKTLAFGLALLERTRPGARPGRPRALVLAPTRELASQIVDVLRPLGHGDHVRVAAFYGGTPIERQVARLRRGVEIAVATPGRLIDLIERRSVDLTDVRIVVVDEADRMADMGFLPQVEWIMRHLGTRAPQTMLFSATLDGQVDVLVGRYLRDAVRIEATEDEPTVSDMTHHFFAVHQMDRVKVAAAVVRGADRTLMFVRTRRGADRLAGQLSREGVAAAAIHGDLRQSARERALGDFSAGKLEVLVATDVAARGIHVDDIDVVVHFDPPADHKGYLHRSGRTARAGQTGAVATFVLWDQERDVELLKKRLGLAEPTIEVFSNDPRLTTLAGPVVPAADRGRRVS
ncbi:MAG: DEAD/DEAH box helicase [Acidimicrobiales bacterium]